MHTRVAVAVMGAAGLLAFCAAREARACAGLFSPAQQPPPEGLDGGSTSAVQSHLMILSVSPTQTTLYDEVQFQGSNVPQDFAWVLPIRGTVTVGLSSGVLFNAIDMATETTIVPPPSTCPTQPPCPCLGMGGALAADSGVQQGGVTVLSQSLVGPYDTVQLQSTDPNALTTWLTANGYNIPAAIQPVIAAYVSEGFDFLAMRLSTGVGIQAIRPVSVTSSGTGLSLPLRMVAAGTGATVPITLWVIASERYEPQNFRTFTIDPSQLTWDWSTAMSNYTPVQANTDAMFNNAAWQIESSLSISPLQIERQILQRPASVDYAPTTSGLPVALDADGGLLPTGALEDAGGFDDASVSDDAGAPGDAGPILTADQVRQQDLATCFPGGNATEVRITRMRADLSHAALANDLVLQASSDQSTLSNQDLLTHSVNAPACPPIPSCPCPLEAGLSSAADDGGLFVNGPSATVKNAGSGQQTFGCTAATARHGLGGSMDDLQSGESSPLSSPFGLGLGGLVAVSMLRGRATRKTKTVV